MLAVGTEFIDNFRIKLTHLIAEGGMGAVYECVIYGPEGFEKIACVKLIKDIYSRKDDFRGRFVHEAKLVADLVHQNIVQVYQLGKTGDQFFILMEYVKGIDLSILMRRLQERNIRIPADLGAFIISRVCRGLEYAHNKKNRYGVPLNVVHRDISPKNIMISSEGEIKITDFGVAQTLEGDKCLAGKLSYMSPEQVLSHHTDKRSDIFSLGIVMFELLSGSRLFGGGADSKSITDNVLSMEIPGLGREDIPEQLEKIMLKALERDAYKRYQNASEMGYDLEYFMYHKGYGPTIQTMQNYLGQLFPDLFEVRREPGAQETIIVPGTGPQETIIIPKQQHPGNSKGT
jgi:serine/threonine-protein kinase